MSTKPQTPVAQKKSGTIEDIRMVDGKTFVTVRLPGGEVLGGYQSNNVEDNSITIDPAEITWRVTKANDESVAAVQSAGDKAAIIGSASNFIVSTEKYGNFVSGPTVFTAHPEAIKFGGVYRFNPLLTSTTPSTIVTPISTFILDLPGLGLISTLQDMISQFKSLVV